MKKMNNLDAIEDFKNIFWIAQYLWNTSEQLTENYDSKLDPIQNRIYDASICYFLSKINRNMGEAEKFAEKTISLWSALIAWV